MFNHIKKIWIDPVWSKVIAAGIIAICTAFAALFTHILTPALFTYFLTARVPLWGLLAALFIIVLLLPSWLRAIRKKKAELYVVWEDSAGWGIGGLEQKDGIERVLRIQGAAIVSSAHLEETVIVTRVELKDAEYAGPNFQMFEVKPRQTTRHTLLFNFRGVKPEKGKAFKVDLTLVDIKGNRYPLKPAMLRAFPGPELPTNEPLPSPLDDGSLVINSPDQFSLLINKVDSGGIRGIQIQVVNNRLTSIHQSRVILSSASSFDRHHGAFREASLTGQTFARPDVIRPSCSGNPILLVWKGSHSTDLVTGEKNVLRPLRWPDRDKAEIEKWKLSLRVLVFAWPANASGESTPLKELFAEITMLWNRARNEFSIEKFEGATACPDPPLAFPLNGEDGTHREIALFITYGHDQLLAYKTNREGLPGTRFLVVRVRPNQVPQSVETPDRDSANNKWNEWYREWKERGFGGASGNGLDGAPPF